MKSILFVLSLCSVLLLTACAGKHKNCLDADAFGHCNHWKGQEISCTERVFGVCTNKGRQNKK